MEKPWEGRFSEKTDEFVERFTQSVSFDRRLALEDIRQSIAHVKTLQKAGVLTQDEAKAIVEGLNKIAEEIEKGGFEFKESLEDVHMNIEFALAERIGQVGKKLHTGRSRNDQVATDERLHIKGQILEILELLKGLRKALVKLAQNTVDVIVPSYTHLQKAQPIRLAHYFLAYREMFLCDEERFMLAYKMADRSPLGSGAVAGVDFPLDRFFTAHELGFNRVLRNSIQATADRDYILDVLYACASTGMHLSRLAEDLILWSSEEFGFVELPDRLCTGSSIMPQKKNPDVLELIRGKTGRLYGNLMSLLTTLKGLPMAYNRDLQEDKEPLFDSLDTIKACIKAMTLVLDGLTIKADRMQQQAGGFSLMTDLANYLVQKGLPFREAHSVAGKITSYLLKEGKKPEELTLEELKSFSSLYEEDALKLLDPRVSADRRNTYGGTSKEQVQKQVEIAIREEGL
ncbi:argininosuccinate lyase [Thermocrinis minervae]|uniref:Argininosuccinate lyase n=1 Tax=Thermocrinis minervae TaxID=381751 RepID=A0A1M6QNV1_9AQUI|nr:argininosuccinate lyase [Thermocrinis minervae]SHK21896.1 argininosuccinate lyase [Thermocrinis minervae]